MCPTNHLGREREREEGGGICEVKNPAESSLLSLSLPPDIIAESWKRQGGGEVREEGGGEKGKKRKKFLRFLSLCIFLPLLQKSGFSLPFASAYELVSGNPFLSFFLSFSFRHHRRLGGRTLYTVYIKLYT